MEGVQGLVLFTKTLLRYSKQNIVIEIERNQNLTDRFSSVRYGLLSVLLNASEVFFGEGKFSF